MRTVEYVTQEEKRLAIEAAEANNETMIHDDFNVGMNGENLLTFDTHPNLIPIPLTAEQVRKNELVALLSSDRITFEELKELLRIERGL